VLAAVEALPVQVGGEALRLWRRQIDVGLEMGAEHLLHGPAQKMAMIAPGTTLLDLSAAHKAPFSSAPRTRAGHFLPSFNR
jgi:hypothetical protein